MYRKQVFKGGLMRTVIKGSAQQRYFAKGDLKDLFTLDNPEESKMAMQLQSEHGEQMR